VKVLRSSIATPPAALVCLAALVAGCSSVDGLLSGDKVDYRTGAAKTAPLEVPPDLTQLSKDGRYQPQAGVISASRMGQPATAPQLVAGVEVATAKVAPVAYGNVRIERQGDRRWLVTSLTPDQVWPQVRAFWVDRGFKLEVDDPVVGVIETEWAEDRAKLPQDMIRRTLGSLVDSLFSTGLRDKFKTRIERVDGGSEIFITHRGIAEVPEPGFQSGGINWKPRPSDPVLEGEMLAMMMSKIGSTAVAAAATTKPVPGSPAGGAAPIAPVPAAKAHARAVTGQASAGLEIDESFDRAWRQVGVALDRSGFTVEDRDRGVGVYFVRYVDPKQAGRDEPNIFQRLFNPSDANKSSLQRFRIALKSSGDKTTGVVILNAQGTPDNGEGAQHIVARLVDELK
jgi:outer membrane protein assembly factor BamC